jgi:hypothetical protein
MVEMRVDLNARIEREQCSLMAGHRRMRIRRAGNEKKKEERVEEGDVWTKVL